MSSVHYIASSKSNDEDWSAVGKTKSFGWPGLEIVKPYVTSVLRIFDEPPESPSREHAQAPDHDLHWSRKVQCLLRQDPSPLYEQQFIRRLGIYWIIPSEPLE